MSTDPSTEVTEPVETAAIPTDPGTDHQPKLTSEQKKAQILESFEERLDSGELTLEEVEARQPWVAEAIKAKREPKPEAFPTESLNKMKDEMKEEILADLEVKNTKNQVYAIATKSQKEEFDNTVAEYKDSLGEAKAVALAVRVSGIDLSSQASTRRNLSHPSFGNADTESTIRVTESDRKMANQMGVEPEVVAKNRAAVEAKSL